MHTYRRVPIGPLDTAISRLPDTAIITCESTALLSCTLTKGHDSSDMPLNLAAIEMLREEEGEEQSRSLSSRPRVSRGRAVEYGRGVGGFVKGGTLLSLDEGRRVMGSEAEEEDEDEGGGVRGRGRKRPLIGGGKTECPSKLYAELTTTAEKATGAAKRPVIKVELDDETTGFLCEVCHERITKSSRQVRLI